MRTFLLSITLLCCGIGISGAQEQAGAGTSLTDQIKDLCDLSPEQVAKVQPIVTNFEIKRDETYRKYRRDKVTLAKEVKKYKWDYEVSLIGIFNPEQMGLLKAFDQMNKPLMTGSGTSVTSVAYLRSGPDTNTSAQVAVQTNKPADITPPAPEPVVADVTAVQANSESNVTPAAVASAPVESVLTEALKDVCSITPEQMTQVKPIITAFEMKRDSIYKKYRHNKDKDVFSRSVRRNRLNYEVAMISVLNPDQMRILRAFNLSNRGLMAGSNSVVHTIEFLPANPATIAAAHSTPQPDANTDKPADQANTTPATADKTVPVAAETSLTDELKDLCDLTPDQVIKVQPLVATFERKRDSIYAIYQHKPTELTKMVKQNRWDYEVSMIGTLNPSQMGLLKVFDQRNPDLMTHTGSRHVNKVNYFADAK